MMMMEEDESQPKQDEDTGDGGESQLFAPSFVKRMVHFTDFVLVTVIYLLNVLSFHVALLFFLSSSKHRRG